MDYKKNTLCGCVSRVGHRARVRVQEWQGEKTTATLVFYFRRSTRDATTEHIFLIIHNSGIFHPNNLKFCEKLLCTYMYNFPTGSFLQVKLPQILFVGKVRKTRTKTRLNLIIKIYYKQSTILILWKFLLTWMVFFGLKILLLNIYLFI